VHPFQDGNCRTMLLLLNKLLFDNGFTPVIMANPNQLDGLSNKELGEIVKESM